MQEFDLSMTLDLLLGGGLTSLVLGTLVYLQVAALRRTALPRVDGLWVAALALALSAGETLLAFWLGKLGGALPGYGWPGVTAFGLLTGLVAVGMASAQRDALLKALPLIERLLIEILVRARKS